LHQLRGAAAAEGQGEENSLPNVERQHTRTRRCRSLRRFSHRGEGRERCQLPHKVGLEITQTPHLGHAPAPQFRKA
jgi:hypothetical protein